MMQDERPMLQAPALTQEVRQNQLINLAIQLAEKQLMQGTASSQVITHYLKLGTTRQRLQKEKLEKQNELLRAKTQALQSQRRIEELYANALSAMRSYNGQIIANEDPNGQEL